MHQNWAGGTDECLNDGNEPAYMTNTQYMYTTIELCCESRYLSTYNTCAGTGITDSDGTDSGAGTGTSISAGLYYPVSAHIYLLHCMHFLLCLYPYGYLINYHVLYYIYNQLLRTGRAVPMSVSTMEISQPT